VALADSFLAILSGVFVLCAAGAASPDDIWTQDKKKALVWLKIAPASGEPHYGTGFLVRAVASNSMSAATHVVQGNTPRATISRATGTSIRGRSCGSNWVAERVDAGLCRQPNQ